MKLITMIIATALMTTQAGAVSLMPSAKDEHKQVSRVSDPEHDECNGKLGKYTVNGLKCNWEAAGVVVETRRANESRETAKRYPEGSMKRKLHEGEAQYHDTLKTYRRERMDKLLSK